MAWKLFGRNWLTGIICMWHGLIVDIPNGWALCDGSQGTPDLREQFVRGAPTGIDPGHTGGGAMHFHSVVGNTGWGWGAHTHEIVGDTGYTSYDSSNYTPIAGGAAQYVLHQHPIDFTSQSGSGAHRHSVSIASFTAGHIPPFYTILFIMKL